MRGLASIGALCMLFACARESSPTSTSTSTASASSTSTASATSSATGTTPPTVGGADGGISTKPSRVEAPADAEVAGFIRTMRGKAAREGRTVIVEVGASWCKPCRTLKAAIDRGELDDVLANVTVIAFDADAHGPRLDSLGYTSKFIPYFAVPKPDGSASELRLDVKLKSDANAKEIGSALGTLVQAAKR